MKTAFKSRHSSDDPAAPRVTRLAQQPRSRDKREISAARERLSMSMSELARRVGVSASHMLRIENGECGAGEPVLKKIAGELSLDFDQLMIRCIIAR